MKDEIMKRYVTGKHFVTGKVCCNFVIGVCLMSVLHFLTFVMSCFFQSSSLANTEQLQSNQTKLSIFN